MADQLTAQQKQAVFDRGGRLLGSAAAGSGKTKVLVDRLLSYVMDSVKPVNVDDFLIITYTKAAASELRGKIASRLSELIATTPENKHLQRQMQRLHLTKISTVHAFCADILREYAYMLDISSDFRVADENECIELQSKALSMVLESAYSDDSNPDFYAFVDSQGFGRDDRRVPEIILKVYNAAKCHLDPEKWLNWCEEIQRQENITDVGQTVWGRYLIDSLHSYLDLQIDALNVCAEKASFSEQMEKPAQLLVETVDQLRMLRMQDTWDEICRYRTIDYGRLNFSKKCTDTDLIEQIKAVRDACKAGLEKKLSAFCDSSEQILSDNRKIASASNGLISLVRQFDSVYSGLKNGRRILDFTDLEHKTLDLLLGKSRSGATKASREIAERFVEVMVDEYQDSNAVQDAIFGVLTERKQNCFMVGDVKQSIYQFRLADPSIFIEKYNDYACADNAEQGRGRRVVLSKNFRSSAAVIQAVNDVFSACMTPEVGGLYYGPDEALNEGLSHIALNEPEVEFFGVDVQEDVYREEALFVAEKIKTLLDGKHMVRQGDNLRPITPDDIVILLRSPGSVGWEYQAALEQCGILCSSGAGDDLMKTEEIEVLCSLLRAINNPLLDIPLVSVMLSRLFRFSADELAKIRESAKGGSIYSAVGKSQNERALNFIKLLSDLRNAAQMCSISQLLAYIFTKTRIDTIYSAMPDGEVRAANLQQFCQLAAAYESGLGNSLSRFLKYLDSIEERGLPASGGDGSSGAVTIMSIHKSKGLEFPVVFLCGLSREFNMESASSQVLCDKELGLGLACVDIENRVQYPSIAKKAISEKIKKESVSEEMRVLYVAMTRARDRLIMTYSVKNLERNLNSLSLRIPLSRRELLTSTAHCPGTWVYMASCCIPAVNWKMQTVQAVAASNSAVVEKTVREELSVKQVKRLNDALCFTYPHALATIMPSKQTATQLKGREKDREAAENTVKRYKTRNSWRQPSFVNIEKEGVDRGLAVHSLMQYIHYRSCADLDSVRAEIQRLVAERYISSDQAHAIIPEQVFGFFDTEMGKKIRTAENVLREFKFSILMQHSKSSDADQNDRVLIQGVVDCALIESDGITVIDFKSDRIGDDDLANAAERYRDQVLVYADALSKIYRLPVKAALLYFFTPGKFVTVI